MAIVGIAVMMTAFSMAVCAVRPGSDSPGSRPVSFFTALQESVNTHQGETERPFSHEVPALEASSHASTLIVPIRSEHGTSDSGTVLTAAPDLPSEFRSSPPKSHSIRISVLRI